MTDEEKELISCPTRDKSCRVGDCVHCGWNKNKEDHQADLLRFQHTPAWPKDPARDGLD